MFPAAKTYKALEHFLKLSYQSGGKAPEELDTRAI